MKKTILILVLLFVIGTNLNSQTYNSVDLTNFSKQYGFEKNSFGNIFSNRPVYSNHNIGIFHTVDIGEGLYIHLWALESDKDKIYNKILELFGQPNEIKDYFDGKEKHIFRKWNISFENKKYVISFGINILGNNTHIDIRGK